MTKVLLSDDLVSEQKYSLVKETDPILREEAKEFDFDNPPLDPYELSEDMMKVMHEHNGYGLSAPQIGVPYRVFVMKAAPFNFVCFNPRVVMPSEDTILMEEGCLSFPGLVVEIKRPQHVRFRFQTPSGQTDTQQFTGMTARVIQHEIDHLNGILFYERATKFHRDRAFRKRKQFLRKQKKQEKNS